MHYHFVGLTVLIAYDSILNRVVVCVSCCSNQVTTDYCGCIQHCLDQCCFVYAVKSVIRLFTIIKTK